MLDKLTQVEKRYEELNTLMAEPEVATDPLRLREYAQEQAEIEEVVQAFRRYRAVTNELLATRKMLEETLDDEMRKLVGEEIEQLEARQAKQRDELKALLLPRDARDEKNVIMEIRAGAGGDEAGLFAADLYRMYTRYAENQGWEVELINANRSGIGGFKEVIFQVKGRGAYSRLKYESGVHRVQRVPATEASGRIHTSTATVAVLPEMDEVEVNIDPDDLRIETYRSSGPGGQHMQKNETAVRVIHLPTGLVVSCENQRSQFQNWLNAMAILRARLYDLEESKRHQELDQTRRSQVGTGERSEKIRTYNFPQDRVTDHRIGLTRHNLPAILEGDLDEIIDTVATADQAERLKAASME